MRARSCPAPCPERPASWVRWRRSRRKWRSASGEGRVASGEGPRLRVPDSRGNSLVPGRSASPLVPRHSSLRRRRLGVIGTFVWDIIHGRDPRDAPVEEWGGITYALSGLDAALPADWEIVPLMKVGSDLAPRASDFLRTLRRLAPDAALVEVPYPNNRVELRYFSAERRSEVLTGGVPGWTWVG